MTDIVPPLPSSSPVPLRPHKSRLRSLSTMDQLSIHSSNSSINSTSPTEVHPTSPIDMLPDSMRSLAPSILSVPATPVKSKYRSRFKEHFDGTRTPMEKPEKLKTSKSLGTITSNQQQQPALIKKMPKSNKNSASTHTMVADELNLPLDPLITTTTTPAKRVQLTTSISTPLQLPTLGSTMTPKPIPRKHGSNGSILTSKSATTMNTSSSTSLQKSISNISYNRADIIIARLESWHTFLKSVTSWIEETIKINSHSSRGYYQRAYPHLDDSCAISTTTTTMAASNGGDDNNSNHTTTVEQNINQAMLTVQAGFQTLTMQIAAEQQQFSKCLERDHLPALMKLRKEVKDKVHKLKNDPTLVLDELLRRAEVTRSRMTHLSRCCKQADKTKGQVEMDPWLANLMVLRQLKREIDEENRLRLLMVPIQNDAKEFETRLINLVKPAIQYCYKVLAPGAWDGTGDKDAAPFEFMLDQIKPDYEWHQFEELHKKDLVDEQYPKKDYLKINYPNKFHPLVLTLLKGTLERKFGVRKQFTERNFVLSQGGYLHQFSMDDKVSPEKTIYIPNTTIVPSIDIHQLSKETVFSEYGSHDTSNTFEICRPASNVLQRDKISLFRTSTREDLITWCRLLLHIASGTTLDQFNVAPNEETYLRNSSSLSDELENQSSISVRSPPASTTTPRKNSVNTTNSTALITQPTLTVAIKTFSNVSSPARSICSVRTEESFNEPAAMTKTTLFLGDNAALNKRHQSTESMHDSVLPSSAKSVSTRVIKEETSNSGTDTESFVTARFKENNMDTDNDEEELIDDYFSVSHVEGESKYNHTDEDNDAVSIASTSTAKGPTAATTSNNSPITKSPSMASTTFDDAQSSLYFSSASAPNSPTASNRSSLVSIPDFQLFPEVISCTNVNEQENTRLSEAQMYKAALNLSLENNTEEDDA